MGIGRRQGTRGGFGLVLAKSFNVDPTSPFFQRFTMEGVAPGENQNLTIPEIVNGLVRATLLGKAGKAYSLGYLSGSTDEETIVRSKKILNGYFGHLRDANTARWDYGKLAHICVNAGVRAHLQLIAEIIRYIQSKDEKFDSQTEFEAAVVARITKIAAPIFSFVQNASDAVISEKFSRQYGEGGVREYFFNLCEVIHSKISDFGSTEFLDHLNKRHDQRAVATSQLIIDLEKQVRDYLVHVLKKVHGSKELKSGEKTYWELGIESQTAKDNAYNAQKSAPPDKRLPKEAYLNLLDIMKIVR